MDSEYSITEQVIQSKSKKKRKPNENCVKIDKWIWNGYVFSVGSKCTNHIRAVKPIPDSLLVSVRIIFAIYLLGTSAGATARESNFYFLFTYYQLWVTTIYFIMVVVAHLIDFFDVPNSIHSHQSLKQGNPQQKNLQSSVESNGEV